MRRFFEAALTLFVAAVVVFFLIHLVPGDPAQAVLGEKATPEAIAVIRKELGLDRPLSEQLVSYLTRLTHGDLGRSIRSGQPVLQEVKDRLPATLELALLAMVFSILGGITLGMFAAKRPGSWMDLFLGGFSTKSFLVM